MYILAGSIFLSFFTLSCGRVEQKVELKNRLLEDVNDPNCKVRDCPELSFKLVDSSNVDITTKTFEGVQNLKIEWTVKVNSTAPAGRIKIAPLQWPGWMRKRDLSTAGSMQIIGVPDSVVSENTVKILARDISRCAALEKTSKDCSNAQASLPDYDKVFTLRYSIKAP